MFFNKDKDEEKIKNYNLNNIASLLIHAAKIDDNFSNQEEEIIKKALIKMGANNRNVENIIKEGKIKEANST